MNNKQKHWQACEGASIFVWCCCKKREQMLFFSSLSDASMNKPECRSKILRLIAKKTAVMSFEPKVTVAFLVSILNLVSLYYCLGNSSSYIPPF